MRMGKRNQKITPLGSYLECYSDTHITDDVEYLNILKIDSLSRKTSYTHTLMLISNKDYGNG